MKQGIHSRNKWIGALKIEDTQWRKILNLN